jgi:serine/threonine protein kinase
MNLVQLLGYYIQVFQHMLVYEYMSNSSIDKLLSYDNLLNWVQRIHIIKGIVQGLAYLNHECNPRIVHLDIKPQNILLDEDYTPKLVDFGSAKIINGVEENMVFVLPFSFFFWLCVRALYCNGYPCKFEKLCFIPWKFHKFIVIGHWENI